MVATCLFSLEETAPYVGAMATQTFELWKKGREKKWTVSAHTLHNVQTCDNVHVQSATQWVFGTYFTHVQTCDNIRVQSATQWIASVHTLYDMSKPVITFVFKVLRNGLLRYILLMSKPVITQHPSNTKQHPPRHEGRQRATGCRPPGIGHRPPARRWPPPIGHPAFASGHRPPATAHRPSANGHLPPATGHRRRPRQN